MTYSCEKSAQIVGLEAGKRAADPPHNLGTLKIGADFQGRFTCGPPSVMG